MQNKDVLRPVLEPLLTEARGLLASEPGIEERVGVLLRIARAEATLGQPDAAKKTRAEAVALARTLPASDPKLSPMLWPSVAIAHEDAGDSATAKALFAEGVSRAQKLKEAERRFYGLAWLALYQASPKNAAAAKATMALAVKSAPAVAASPDGQFMQTSLLGEVGAFAAAKARLLASKRDPANTILSLGNLATKQAKTGDKAGAKATLAEAMKRNQTIKSELERRMTQSILLGYAVQVGDAASAKKLAGTDPKARQSVAEALAETGDTDGAKALSSEPSAALVYALASKGKVADAQKEAERVLADPGSTTMQDEPIRLLGAIAAAQAKAGDTTGASATLEQARKRITDDKTFGDKRLVLTASLIESIVTGGKRDR
ncbi:hypothetical protein [Armatimonas rosea]|uniref:Tetratricopeptide repeat protein n=1 Tax=Armatimonas rosea TaxID=685828 RepID=A0A7W9SPV5_ARMRO|nr:hypothetical protein [Armatimonas rosea]MBB6050004.1 hypothetical protein [Armatimonas rosea]